MSENEYAVAGYTYGIGIVSGLLSTFDTLGNITWASELYLGIEIDNIFSSVE